MPEEFELKKDDNRSVQKNPVPNEELTSTLSKPDQMDDGEGDWGFTIFADKEVFLATVSYPSQAEAIRGRFAMVQALKEVIFIATSES